MHAVESCDDKILVRNIAKLKVLGSPCISHSGCSLDSVYFYHGGRVSRAFLG